MYEDITDRRPINAGEARRGLEFVKEHWPPEAQAELRELPADEAAVMLMLAGELGAIPCNESEIESMVETTSPALTLQPRETPEAHAQLDLLGRPSLDSYPVEPYPTDHVGPPDGLTIEQAFWQFHDANPQVYQELVALSRRGVGRGVGKLGIGMLFEVLRWNHALRTGGDEFKLNNNYRSYYARLIMLQEIDLEGVFETRRLHAPT